MPFIIYFSSCFCYINLKLDFYLFYFLIYIFDLIMSEGLHILVSITSVRRATMCRLQSPLYFCILAPDTYFTNKICIVLFFSSVDINHLHFNLFVNGMRARKHPVYSSRAAMNGRAEGGFITIYGCVRVLRTLSYHFLYEAERCTCAPCSTWVGRWCSFVVVVRRTSFLGKEGGERCC